MPFSPQGQNYYKISTSFEFSIEAPIREGLVTVGRFLLQSDADARRLSAVDKADREAVAALSVAEAPPAALSLACASSGQKVVLHNNNSSRADGGGSPMAGGGGGNSMHTLTFGKEATALAAGCLNYDSKFVSRRWQDALFFGAATSLLAYDVDNNKQYYYKDVEDGVQTLVCDRFTLADGIAETPLAIVGGNCSVYGFDREGAERYWTVTGDVVSAMASLSWEEGGPPMLVAASEDAEIRIFRGEEVLASLTEVDRVRRLVPAQSRRPVPAADGTSRARPGASGRFAYLLDNGTVGVYQKGERVWRVKGNSVPTSAAFCDIDRDGVDELIVGWQSGRIEVRSDVRPDGANKGGEVLFRETFSAPVAAVLAEDYRGEGRDMPIVCTVDGTVRGLTLLQSRMEEAEETRSLQALEALEKERQQLKAQLADLEEQLALKQKGEQDALMPEAEVCVHAEVGPDPNAHQLLVTLYLENANSDTVIHSCILQSEAAVFESGDCACYATDHATQEIRCGVPFPTDVAATILASVVVGAECAESFQVHEVEVRVPRFVMQVFAPPGTYSEPEGRVTLHYRGALRLEAISHHLHQMFDLDTGISLLSQTAAGDCLRLELLHAREGECVGLQMTSVPTTSTIEVHTETMAVAGDLITALAEVEGGLATDPEAPYPVDVSCEYPAEMKELRELIESVDASNEVRQKLSADMADSATMVKTLLLRAEDARLLGDYGGMRKTYATLYDVDRELIGENAKRVRNYDELKTILKEVNSFIQRAGKLRVGPAKTELVSACRTALKENKTTSLIDIIRTGKV